MLFYPHLIISREQHDWQILSLATRAHQTLGKTGHFSLNHLLTFRFNTQSYRSGCRNALLRQQLIVLNRQIKRPQLTNSDRFRLVLLSVYDVLETSPA